MCALVETKNSIFFFGSSACFSQFHPARFVVRDVIYQNAEQYMMAQKALLFHDEECYKRILAARHPKDMKSLGRQVKGFDEAVWAKNRFRIVVEGNTAKFSQNPALRAQLLKSGTKDLVEASPYDRVWGIGLSVDEARRAGKDEWRGLNLLGEALMAVRDSLRSVQVD